MGGNSAEWWFTECLSLLSRDDCVKKSNLDTSILLKLFNFTMESSANLDISIYCTAILHMFSMDYHSNELGLARRITKVKLFYLGIVHMWRQQHFGYFRPPPSLSATVKRISSIIQKIENFENQTQKIKIKIQIELK